MQAESFDQGVAGEERQCSQCGDGFDLGDGDVVQGAQWCAPCMRDRRLPMVQGLYGFHVEGC